MQIRCPECQLERTIDPSSIPSTAVMATCPQCKARFRFRTLPDETPEGTSPTPSQDEPIQPAETGGAKPVQLTPDVPAVETTASDTDETEPPAAKPVQLTPAGKPASGPTDSKGESPLRAKNGNAEEHGGAAAEAEWLDVPWERPERYGHLTGLYHTIIRVMFSPPRFFATLSKCRGSILRPLLFYVLLGLFQTLVKLMWFQSVAPSVTDPQVQELLSSTDMSLALMLVVSPVILAAQLFFYAALFFLMLRLVQPEQVVFATVLRVVAYSSAPMIVCAVPVLGPVVGLVWFAVCCFLGCRYALHLQWHKVALALVPLYLIGFVITMQFVEHLLQQG